jgi:ATP-binding protein involved in chromosome partitioning
MKIKHKLDQVSKIILVAAGKGGVGKSTISLALAEQLTSQGALVGIVDADIYGPSIPMMLGLTSKPDAVDGKIIPLESRGIKAMSMGMLVPSKSAVVWRGPMANKAIFQLIYGVAWGALDYLIIDTPPGTGDIHLSILENYHIDGVMIVTTPQKIAALDVGKAIDLYKKFHVPIMGIIENMSGAFVGNAGEELAKIHGVPLLACIPLIREVSENADEGKAIGHLIENIIPKTPLPS